MYFNGLKLTQCVINFVYLLKYIKYPLSLHYYTSLDKLHLQVGQVLDSLPPEIVALICGWNYIVLALFATLRIGITIRW